MCISRLFSDHVTSVYRPRLCRAAQEETWHSQCTATSRQSTIKTANRERWICCVWHNKPCPRFSHEALIRANRINSPHGGVCWDDRKWMFVWTMCPHPIVSLILVTKVIKAYEYMKSLTSCRDFVAGRSSDGLKLSQTGHEPSLLFSLMGWVVHAELGRPTNYILDSTGTSTKNWISWKRPISFVPHFRKWNPYII